MDSFRTMFACRLVLLLLLGVGCSDEVYDEDVTTARAAGDARALGHITLALGEGVTMKLALVPAGKFLMGSKPSAAEVARMFNGKEERFTDEHPRHEVTISRSFYLGTHEVTQAQWRAVMGTEPWKGKVSWRPGDSNAASWMDWHEANEFCEKLSGKTGRKVALPTEAQWEYACRAVCPQDYLRAKCIHCP